MIFSALFVPFASIQLQSFHHASSALGVVDSNKSVIESPGSRYSLHRKSVESKELLFSERETARKQDHAMQVSRSQRQIAIYANHSASSEIMKITSPSSSAESFGKDTVAVTNISRRDLEPNTSSRDDSMATSTCSFGSSIGVTSTEARSKPNYGSGKHRHAALARVRKRNDEVSDHHKDWRHRHATADDVRQLDIDSHISNQSESTSEPSESKDLKKKQWKLSQGWISALAGWGGVANQILGNPQ